MEIIRERVDAEETTTIANQFVVTLVKSTFDTTFRRFRPSNQNTPQ